ncbi:hypothetical protein ACFYNL_22975 [Streptomyces sp. NPDC007808]|uniref:hypothetical protein n=1 Tax=Streptomyces sp. NPDC007808 TaxID=3364779 RepID=UPI0036806431
MDTSLTPEFWERSAVLLVAATAVTFVLTATLDALTLRRLRRRAHRPLAHTRHAVESADRGTSVHC